MRRRRFGISPLDAECQRFSVIDREIEQAVYKDVSRPEGQELAKLLEQTFRHPLKKIMTCDILSREDRIGLNPRMRGRVV